MATGNTDNPIEGAAKNYQQSQTYKGGSGQKTLNQLQQLKKLMAMLIMKPEGNADNTAGVEDAHPSKGADQEQFETEDETLSNLKWRLWSTKTRK